MKKKYLALEKKFIYILGIFNAFVCVLIPVGLTFYSFQYENIKIDRLIKKIPQVIEREVYPHMEPFDQKFFERFFKAAINIPELKYIKISDPQDKILVEQRKGNQPDKYIQDYRYKLIGPKNGKHLGYIDLIVSRDKIYEEIISEFTKTFMALVIWSLILSLIIGFTFKSILINPLNLMIDYLTSLRPNQTTFPGPLKIEKLKYLNWRDQLDDVAVALESATRQGVQANIDNRDRYKIIEAEVVKRTEEVLNEKQKADEANEEKTEFIGHISHEIRNPINAISGFVELLADKVKDPEHLELINPLQTATGSLLGLLNDLVDMSKADLGRLTIEMKVIDAKRSIENIEKMFSPRVRKKGLDFIVKVDPGFPNFFKSDGLRLAQVLQNLVGNSIKFTEQGYIKMTLSSKKLAVQGKESITILVEDTGIGIPLKEREKIFEKYRQTTGQSYAKYQGSGLGLSISKKIAKLLGGDLKVIDKEGPGSCFKFILKEVDVVEKENVEEVEEKIEEYKFFDSKVLVVDDEKLNRDLVMWNLRPYKLKLFFAENGKEALNKALINKPDLILMDLLMPSMDGIESMELIKVYENLKDIPIIVISAIINSENEEKIKNLANSMMRKPVLQKKLVKELAKYLPHEILTKDKSVKEDKVTRLPKGSPIPLQLEKILREKFLARVGDLKDNMSIDEIKEFASQLKTLADENDCKTISIWSENLLAQSRSFNIEEIEKSFDNFRELLADAPAKKKAS